MTRNWRLRAGPGALIVLAHLLAFAVLVRYAGTPPARDEYDPADYIMLALVPPKARLTPAPAAAPTAPLASRKRKASLRQETPGQETLSSALPMAVPGVQEAQEEPAQEAPQGKGLDMAILRADARRIAREHVPEPFEQVRDAERRLESEEKELGRAIAKAKRPPCTKKYSGGTSFNVFALIPLAIDTITDTGCKW